MKKYIYATIFTIISAGLVFGLLPVTQTPIISIFFFAALLTVYLWDFKAALIPLFGCFATALLSPPFSLGDLLRRIPFLIGITITCGLISRVQTLNSKLTKAEAIVSNTDDAIFSLDLDGKIDSWNNGAERIYGYKESEVLGRHVSLLIPAKREGDEEFILAEIRKGKKVEHYETLRKRKDGVIIDVSLTISPIRGLRGKIVGASKIARDITARKEVERELLASEERFRSQFKGTPVPIFSWQRQNGDFVLTDYNDAALQITKGRIPQLKNKKASEVYVNVPEVIELMNESFLNRKTIRRSEAKFKLITTGEEKYLDVSFVYVPPDLVLIHTEDITERKGIQDKIKQSEERYMLAQEAAGIASWEWDVLTKTTHWSKNLPKIYGLEPDELTYERFMELVHPDERAQVKATLESLSETNDNYDTEFRIIRPDGQTRWIAAKGKLFKDEQGEPRKLVGSNMDITERKLFEERFRLVFELSPTPLIIADENGQIVQASEQAERLLRYGRMELIGKPLTAIMPERFRERHNKAYYSRREFRATGALKELFALAKDGTEIPVEVAINPIKIEDKDFVLGSIVDMTERHKAEEEKETLLQLEKQAKERAEVANKAKDQFLAVLSHELKTPLSSILGYATMLSSGNLENKPELITTALKTIERNARTQVELIEDLLDVSRIISGKVVLKKLIVGISGVVQQVVDSLSIQANDKKVKIETHILNDRMFVNGDPQRLQQIFTNVLSNAIKFNKEGGKVSVTIRPNKFMMYIIIEDTGIGLSDDIKAHLFQRFHQAEGAVRRRFGGLGLGLSIAKDLVDLHGGTIKGESEGEDKGSKFTIALPMASPPLEEPSVKHQNSKVSKDALKDICVLVVDDDPDTLEMLSLALRRYGANVVAIDSAEGAKAKLQQEKVNIIVSDIGMPVVDGLTFMRGLREEDNTLPSIALTAFTGEEYAVEAKNSGFDGYLSKPVELDSLVNTILETIDNKK